MKRYLVLVLGVLLMFFAIACESEKKVQMEEFDVSGYYIGNLTVSKLETVEEESWEGHNTDVEFSIIKEGKTLTLTHMSMEHDEYFLDDDLDVNMQILNHYEVEEENRTKPLQSAERDSILNYGESYTGNFNDETGVFLHKFEEYGVLKLNFKEAKDSIIATGYFEFDDKDKGLKDKIDVMLKRVAK